jgi:hypothetical protein
MKRTWLHLLYLIYCAEAGVYLLLVPWSAWWWPLSLSWPGMGRGAMATGAVRGAISALGGLLLVVCGVDLTRFCRALRRV